MDIYFYDPEYNFYTHTDEAEYLNGEYLIPANSTDISPPSVAEGCVAVFSVGTGSWTAIVDNRGTYYNTETEELTVFQDPSQSTLGFTKVVPPTYVEATHHLEWQVDKWVVVADVDVPSSEITAASPMDQRLSYYLKTHKTELSDYLLEGLGQGGTPWDRFAIIGAGSSDIQDVLGFQDGDYSSLIFGEFAKLQSINEKLNILSIDPYELKDFLNNLPPQ